MKLRKYNKRPSQFSNGQIRSKEEKEYNNASNVSVKIFMDPQIGQGIQE